MRRNTGQDYRGCLIITVSQSRVLYQQIDGLFHGLVASVSPEHPGVEPTLSREPSSLASIRYGVIGSPQAFGALQCWFESS